MKPEGCERHRWVKPRGRNKRERMSQNFRSSRGESGVLCASSSNHFSRVTYHQAIAGAFPPSSIVVSELPKTATGQGPEVYPSRQARDFEAVTGLTNVSASRCKGFHKLSRGF